MTESLAPDEAMPSPDPTLDTPSTDAGIQFPTTEPEAPMTDSTSDTTPDESDPAGEVPPMRLADGAAAEADLDGAPDEAGSATAPAPGDAPVADAPGETAETGGADARLAALEHEGEVAADYLEGLLDILDLDGDLDLDVEGDRASVAIVGAALDHLVGQRGATLDALQELTRLAVLQSTGERSRLMLDISGYRAARRAELVEIAARAIEQVLATGEPERLSPMNPFERKVVHDAVAAADGVFSESDGEEPSRRVVVKRA